MTPAIQSAAFRFVSVLVVIGVAVALLVYVPDSTVKVIAVGLLSAAILALEEFIKTSVQS